MTTSPASDLCSACGLCCDGWIDGDVRLTSDEADVFRGRVVITLQKLGPSMPQPCAFHTGASCGIYDRRPAVCQQFDCRTLGAMTRGEITRDEAVARIARVKRAAANLHAALRAAHWIQPGEHPGTAWRRFIGAMRAASEQEAFRRTYAVVLMAGAAYAQLAARDIAETAVYPT